MNQDQLRRMHTISLLALAFELALLASKKRKK